MKATTGSTASLFAFDLVWLETVVTGGQAARAEIQHRQTGPLAGLTLAYDFVWTPAGFEFDLGGSRRSNSGSLRDQTPGASEIKLLKKKKEGSCPTSEAPGVRTRTFLFLLQEVDLGGSRSLPAEAPAV